MRRKTGKPSQEIAIRRQELRGGRGAAGHIHNGHLRHPQAEESGLAPKNATRDAPEDHGGGAQGAAGGRPRRQHWAHRPMRRHATFKTAYLPLYIVAPFAARHRLDEVNYPGTNHKLAAGLSVANRASEEPEPCQEHMPAAMAVCKGDMPSTRARISTLRYAAARRPA